MAEPGHVFVPLVSHRLGLEIVDWLTEPRPTEHVGEFIVRFVAPITLGTVLACEPGEVSVSISNVWQLLPSRGEQARELQVLPAPTNVHVDAVRFRIASRAVQQPGLAPSFQARLKFATFLPVRAVNIAATARATASSSTAGTNPGIVVDGNVDAEPSFSTTRAAMPEWLTLTWDTAQSFRGMVLFRSAGRADVAEPRVELFNGSGDPASATGSNDWQAAAIRITAPGDFYANQCLVLLRPAETRAVRLSNTDGAGGVRLSEWAVLQILGNAPAPDPPALTSKSEWSVPYIKAGRIQVDGRDDDWPPGRTNGFALAWDKEWLYLLYQARGAEARFENPGTNASELFRSGDALDFQFQTAPLSSTANVERRIIVSPWRGQAAAVLYESRTEELLVVPTVFKSSSKTVSFDKVTVIQEAKLAVRRADGVLTVEASLPLEVCGLNPQSIQPVRGDIGRIVGGAGRKYWSSASTNLVADIADAAELHPREWGTFRFEKVMP